MVGADPKSGGYDRASRVISPGPDSVSRAFGQPALAALGISALLIWQVTGDGEAAEFEGWALVAVYVILGAITLYQ